VAAVLGSRLSAAGMAELLEPRFPLLKLAAVAVLVHLVLQTLRGHPSVSGNATLQVANAAPLYEAAYFIAAAGRVAQAMQGGQSLEQAMVRERAYLQQHREAAANRAQAAHAVDVASATHGNLLGWRAVLDSRTSAECRAAHGSNWVATHVPLIGWPGAVHPHCRCRAVRPYLTPRRLPTL
jgi:Phage Mu protein F like protein